MLRKVIREIEEEVLRERRNCERYGSVLVRNGQEPKKIKTLVGVVEVRRVRLRCPGCEQDIYPLDEAIGLGLWEQRRNECARYAA